MLFQEIRLEIAAKEIEPAREKQKQNSCLPEQHILPAIHVTAEPACPILDDHFVLYKAGAASEFEGTVDENEDFNPARLCAMPEEFNTKYWTPEWDCEELYRAWTAKRCPIAETWIIRIQVPISFINSLKIKTLWYGSEWKEFVSNCRKR